MNRSGKLLPARYAAELSVYLISPPTRYAADRPFASAVCEGVVEVFRRPSGHDATLGGGGVLDFPVFKAWPDPIRGAVCFEWVTNVPVALPRWVFRRTSVFPRELNF